jgi:hypothetical protein
MATLSWKNMQSSLPRSATRHVGEEPEIEVGLADGVGMAPAGRMATGNAEEGAKAQLALGFRHGRTVMRNARDSCS